MFAPNSNGSADPNPKKLFVGNLAFAVTPADLEQLFGQFGQVVSANLITDRMTGRSKGFAFVEFATEEEALKAVEGLHGQVFQDRDLVVNVARPMADRPPRTFGGPRGGGGGGFNRGGDRGGFSRGGGGGSRGGFGRRDQ